MESSRTKHRFFDFGSQFLSTAKMPPQAGNIHMITSHLPFGISPAVKRAFVKNLNPELFAIDGERSLNEALSQQSAEITISIHQSSIIVKIAEEQSATIEILVHVCYDTPLSAFPHLYYKICHILTSVPSDVNQVQYDFWCPRITSHPFHGQFHHLGIFHNMIWSRNFFTNLRDSESIDLSKNASS